MQTFQISLPDDVASMLKSLQHEESRFIADAVQEKLVREERHSLTAVLIEGYKVRRNEDRIITEEYDNSVGDGL